MSFLDYDAIIIVHFLTLKNEKKKSLKEFDKTFFFLLLFL